MRRVLDQQRAGTPPMPDAAPIADAPPVPWQQVPWQQEQQQEEVPIPEAAPAVDKWLQLLVLVEQQEQLHHDTRERAPSLYKRVLPLQEAPPVYSGHLAVGSIRALVAPPSGLDQDTNLRIASRRLG